MGWALSAEQELRARPAESLGGSPSGQQVWPGCVMREQRERLGVGGRDWMVA